MARRGTRRAPSEELWVTYEAWLDFQKCHRRKSKGRVEGWREFLDALFEDGLTRLGGQPNAGALLGHHIDVYKAKAGKKTLKINPSAAQVAAIDQHAQNTGYSRIQLIAILLRIGYTSLC